MSFLKNNFSKIIKSGVFCFTAAVLVLFSGCSLFFPEDDKDEVTISQTEITVKIGEMYTLTAESALGKKIKWSSSNEEVAQVEYGEVTGIAEGTAYVTASAGVYNASCKVTVPKPEKPKDPEYKLVWSDEFDGNSLDMSKWNYQTGTKDHYGNSWGTDGWGNNELQYYTDGANVKVADGQLEIIAKKQSMGGMQYTSSRIVTRDKQSWTYGYFEAKMKLPAVNGMWPAFWMLPQPTNTSSSDNVYGGWAANGELDIMEAMGRLPDRVYGTVHYGGPWPQNTNTGGTKKFNYKEEPAIDQWHTYGVEWTADYIKWYVDGACYNTINNNVYWSSASSNPSAPFDQPFYILFNLAVDSGWFDTSAKVPSNFTSSSMYVDYVRVYQLR